MVAQSAISPIVNLVLPKGKSKNRTQALINFSNQIVKLAHSIGFKVSARGWAYILENANAITKDEFDHAEKIITECEKRGYIPVDIIAKDEGRMFDCVEEPTDCTPIQYLGRWLSYPQMCENWYTPDWWEGESYYVHCVVEKIDLKTLFSEVSKKFHIPIASGGGWQSIYQRAEYGRRFQEAENRGLQPVLLYAGDFDPGDVMISE
jgi:hypothetical protein